MKFTDGYWCVKKEMEPLYAVEYAAHRINGDELTVYAPGKHISNRGDCLNLGMITIRLSSPMEDVIKVSAVHFEGAAYKGPFAEIYTTSPHVSIEESEDFLVYRTGNTRAVIDKGQIPGESALWMGTGSLRIQVLEIWRILSTGKPGRNIRWKLLLLMWMSIFTVLESVSHLL